MLKPFVEGNSVPHRMNEEVFKHDPEADEWVDPYPRKKRKLRWFITIILLLALYILSVGPAVRLVAKKKISRATMEKIYRPLGALSDASPQAEKILNWYVSLWLPPPGI